MGIFYIIFQRGGLILQDPEKGISSFKKKKAKRREGAGGE